MTRDLTAVFFQPGDLVVSFTDLDGDVGVVTGVVLRKEGHSYFVSWNKFGSERHHYEHELMLWGRDKAKRFIGFTTTPL